MSRWNRPSHQQRWLRLKAAGLCITCGQEPAARGQLCLGCAEKHGKLVASRRLAAIAAGMCSRCQCKPATRGQACESCYQANIASQRRRAARYRKAGRCIVCGQDSQGRPTCEKHRIMANRHSAKRHARLKELGLCVCGKETREGLSSCQECGKRNSVWSKERADSWVSHGKCQQCGTRRGKAGTSRYCRPCADKHTQSELARQRRKREAGLCISCSGPLEGRGYKCRKCEPANSGRICSNCKAPGHYRNSCPEPLTQ